MMIRKVACRSCGATIARRALADWDDDEESARCAITETRCPRCGCLVVLRWPTAAYDIPKSPVTWS
jgi:hypothetical protein